MRCTGQLPRRREQRFSQERTPNTSGRDRRGDQRRRAARDAVRAATRRARRRRRARSTASTRTAYAHAAEEHHQHRRHARSPSTAARDDDARRGTRPSSRTRAGRAACPRTCRGGSRAGTRPSAPADAVLVQPEIDARATSEEIRRQARRESEHAGRRAVWQQHRRRCRRRRWRRRAARPAHLAPGGAPAARVRASAAVGGAAGRRPARSVTSTSSSRLDVDRGLDLGVLEESLPLLVHRGDAPDGQPLREDAVEPGGEHQVADLDVLACA